jgi:hypothetical protein
MNPIQLKSHDAPLSGPSPSGRRRLA